MMYDKLSHVIGMVAPFALQIPIMDIEIPKGKPTLYQKSNIRHHRNRDKQRKAFTSPAKPKLAKLWREKKGFHYYA